MNPGMITHDALGWKRSVEPSERIGQLAADALFTIAAFSASERESNFALHPLQQNATVLPLCFEVTSLLALFPLKGHEEFNAPMFAAGLVSYEAQPNRAMEETERMESKASRRVFMWCSFG